MMNVKRNIPKIFFADYSQLRVRPCIKKPLTMKKSGILKPNVRDKKKPGNSFVRLMHVCSAITPIIAIIFIKSID